MTTIASTHSPAVLERTKLTRQEMDNLKAEFARNGFLIFKNVVPRDKLSTLNVQISHAFLRARGNGALFEGGGTMSGHLNLHAGESARFAYEALERRGIIDLIRHISPVSTRQPYVGGNFNMPGSVAQHYHTDGPYSLNFMIANITVVDTTVFNGAIDVIPGSHRHYLPFWKFVAQGVARRHVRLPSEAGDVLVRVSNMWHRGMPNRSAMPRPMLAFTWENGGSAYDDPFSVDGGDIAFHPNWFRPSRLGRVRERIMIKAPVTYSAYRIVDSMFNSKMS